MCKLDGQQADEGGGAVDQFWEMAISATCDGEHDFGVAASDSTPNCDEERWRRGTVPAHPGEVRELQSRVLPDPGHTGNQPQFQPGHLHIDDGDQLRNHAPRPRGPVVGAGRADRKPKNRTAETGAGKAKSTGFRPAKSNRRPHFEDNSGEQGYQLHFGGRLANYVVGIISNGCRSTAAKTAGFPQRYRVHFELARSVS